MSTKPFHLILVTGAMRSGTSLLQHVLCSSDKTNPFIHGCRYLSSQVSLYAQYAGSDRLYIDSYLGGAQGLFDFTTNMLDLFLKETHRNLNRPDCLVLKNPELSINFPQAADLMPEAQFVVSVRDAKDTVASMLEVGAKHRRAGVDSFLARAGRNIRQLCASYRQFYLPVIGALNGGDSALRTRVLFVSYEDLVERTEGAVDRIAKFSRLPLSVEAMAAQEGWRSAVQQDSDALFRHPRWRAYVTALSGGPIARSSVGRFREVLDETEAEQVDELCADIRKYFGYDGG